MVIDTSALVAIAFGEHEASRMVAAIEADPVRYVGAPTYVEAVVVFEGKMTAGGSLALEALIVQLGLVVVPMGPVGAAAAGDAYRRYGKGRAAAALNLGDCLTYGVAREYDEPLLYKGVDVPQTDIASVAY